MKQAIIQNKQKKASKRLLLFMSATLAILMLCLAAKGENTLSVGLYQLVPDEFRFHQAIEAEWNALHPEVGLDFVQWDCYTENPPDDLDVFVFDSILLYDFLEEEYLMPLAEEDIPEIDDFIPCALAACRVDGILYALPQLLCTNLLFAREGDHEVAGATNINELAQIIGECNHTSGKTPSEEGLLVKIPDEATLALWYLDALTDRNQEYSEWVVFSDPEDLDPEIVQVIRKLQVIAVDNEGMFVPPSGDAYLLGALFAEGQGRALIGFSEIMHAMGDAAEDMSIHDFSLSDSDNYPMLFADIASINARISEEKKSLAVELLNIITGRNAMIASFAPTDADQNPQYLLGTRISIYDGLSENYPIYGRLKEIVTNPKGKVFIIRSGGRVFIEQAMDVFRLPNPSN